MANLEATAPDPTWATWGYFNVWVLIWDDFQTYFSSSYLFELTHFIIINMEFVQLFRYQFILTAELLQILTSPSKQTLSY
jgi:hypothetical protein